MIHHSRQVTSNLREITSPENIINKTNAYGHTLLYCACRSGYANLAKTLIELGANASITSKIALNKYESNLEVASRYTYNKMGLRRNSRGAIGAWTS
jgi:ankyrin repeat protein